MMPVEGFSAALLLGPLGGIVALAYAAGAGSGWGFCVLTVLRITNKQIARLEAQAAEEKANCAQQIGELKAEHHRDIADLKARLREVEDRYTNGMERQLAQVRVSSIQNLRREEE